MRTDLADRYRNDIKKVSRTEGPSEPSDDSDFVVVGDQIQLPAKVVGQPQKIGEDLCFM